jgi:hypothetical protein
MIRKNLASLPECPHRMEEMGFGLVDCQRLVWSPLRESTDAQTQKERNDQTKPILTEFGAQPTCPGGARKCSDIPTRARQKAENAGRNAHELPEHSR